MSLQTWTGSRRWRGAAAAAVAGALALGASLALAGPADAAQKTSLPCDIYASAGTPCVAAHSTTRALFASYNGPLYQVTRLSDGATTDVRTLTVGGYANAATQDAFCTRDSTCVISRIYDQSNKHNDLTIEGAGSNGAADVGAPAEALPVIAGGHAVYGVEISRGMGYRNDRTKGVAVNGQPEGMYMVASGTHVNGGCCFDYGNAEVSNTDTGNGHMDAVNFGTEQWFPQSGPGPWVQADLENGLFMSDQGTSTNPAYTGDSNPFVTALLKNNGQNRFALKDGNAQRGALTTVYDGGEPTTARGYSPMHQEGAIVLGTGGDNSNASIGSFFEGVMTAGYPTDAADAAVQANIVSVGYGGPTGVTGTLTKNAEVSLQVTTPGYTDHYIAHSGTDDTVGTAVVTADSSAAQKAQATFIVRPGLADKSCWSFEAKDHPGDFLRHFDFQVHLQPMDGSFFANDATFCPEPGHNGQGVSFQSFNFPTKYLRHFANTLYVADTSQTHFFDAPYSYDNDTSFLVDQPWAP